MAKTVKKVAAGAAVGTSAVPAVLVDTCAWIDFLRNAQGDLGDQVAQLISTGGARLCGVVAAELLQGVKTEKDAAKLQMLIDRVPSLPTVEADWHAAGNKLQTLRAQGITLPLTDALIWAVAQRHGAVVLTVDKHFLHLDASGTAL
jgi:tRNA(fMet)-specific endonuclease VapC